MCVRIIRHNVEDKYDMHRPIEEQIKGSTEIVVNYIENDESVHHFLDELERLSQTSFSFGMKIRVEHNNTINGAKAKKLTVEATRNMSVNDIIKMMSLLHKETDEKLSELAQICVGNHCDE